MTTPLVSIHGGHSGQFCNHARDSLEDIVLAYIRKGFAWVGITEHMPPEDEVFLYPEERQAGLNPEQMKARFGRYIAEARRLQAVYRDRIDILVAFETEAYSGCLRYIDELIDQYQPDYVVGGVHHVADIPFDYGPSVYRQAIEATGGVVNLYCRYFDRQLELIQKVRPSVVAHLDLIRIFDPDYAQHLQKPGVRERIERNLELISRLGLMLDYNVAALRKGASEPYVSRWILSLAKEMGIAVVPSDDAHSVDTVGVCLAEGIAILEEMGFDTRWPKPGPCR
jgi:histidinol-phosphatase (PHP family)